MFHLKSNENRKSLNKIIVHAKTIKTRYCCELVTDCLYLIIDTHAKSREYPEHQYWPDQSRSIREKNTHWPILSRIGPSCIICITTANKLVKRLDSLKGKNKNT
jgi:hypothetical protein